MIIKIRFLQWIVRKDFQGPTHGRWWCDDMVYLCDIISKELSSCCPMSSPSATSWKMYNHLFHRPSPGPVLRVSDAWPFEAHTVCQWPLDTQGYCSRTGKNKMNGANVGHSGREGASLFTWNYVFLSLGRTRCLVKITNQLPKLYQACITSAPLAVVFFIQVSWQASPPAPFWLHCICAYSPLFCPFPQWSWRERTGEYEAVASKWSH